MTFDQIPQGEQLFVDANPLIYCFNADPVYGAACQALMTRIERQEIVAFTSTQELSDVAHRVMSLEAMARLGWPAQGLAARLKRHPADIQQLSRFRQSVDAVLNSRLQILIVPPALILTAADLGIPIWPVEQRRQWLSPPCRQTA
jgi:hypothetical protein